MGVEKQARMGNDVPSLKEVCLFTVKLVRCVSSKSWTIMDCAGPSDGWMVRASCVTVSWGCWLNGRIGISPPGSIYCVVGLGSGRGG